MGSLALPSSGRVYTDTDILIYSVETHSLYWSILQPLCHAARAGTLWIVTSELALMETLVGPMRSGDAALLTAYEELPAAESYMVR